MTLASGITDLAASVRDKLNQMTPRLLPSGGADGQLLAKSSTSNYAVEWIANGAPEYGTNANGSYMKWPNGVLECWARGLFNVDVAANTTEEVTWTFPHSFGDGLYIITPVARAFNNASQRDLAVQHLFGVTYGVVSTSSAIITVRNTRASSLRAIVDVRAIGTW